MTEAAELLGLLAERSGRTTRDALRALNRLVSGGLVSGRKGEWSLHADRFTAVARAAVPSPAPEDHGGADAATAAVLRAFPPDHAALRRYLVEEDFMARDAGVYWRTGGTVEI